MRTEYLIGLDFGSESARGVLLDGSTGQVIDSRTHGYRHAVMCDSLPCGKTLPGGWALQCAPDYIEAAMNLLKGLGHKRIIRSIGIGFTASSPLPCLADGTPLSDLVPEQPHAYVKLWKHQSAQPWADRINARGGDYLAHCGGRLSGEWLLAKAAQMADEAPELWATTERFIEAGDWLVWQLTGNEVRSESFATYKAHFRRDHGYPQGSVPGLAERLAAPFPIGTSAGPLDSIWCAETGILGQPAVAVAVIDSHVALPALGVVHSGSLMGVLGTSAVFLLLDQVARPLPKGIEGMAFSAAIPDNWCYEAGQAGFGDLLTWFVRTFPHAESIEESFAYYNATAADWPPGQNHLLALDWWNGCRVPFGDSGLNGLLVGLNRRSTATDIYRALLESLCFGARRIIDLLASNGTRIDQLVLTGGLSQKNDTLMQRLADTLGRELRVPTLPHPTAIGAAIHGAVAAGVVPDYLAGAAQFGAREFRSFKPCPEAFTALDAQYRRYCDLSDNPGIHRTMHAIER